MLEKPKKLIELNEEEWEYIKSIDLDIYKAFKAKVARNSDTLDTFYVWVEDGEIFGEYYGD